MGDALGDGEADEKPTYRVSLTAFSLTRYPITFSQYALFLRSLGSEREIRERIDLDAAAEHLSVESGRLETGPEAERAPVTWVPFSGAEDYCRWLGERLGASVSLPTEEQWQYSAAGPEAYTWSLGNAFDRAQYAVGGRAPEAVDLRRANAFGLVGMTGNVFEWCADRYGFVLRPGPDQIVSESRVIKGGSFVLGEAANFRNAKRFSLAEVSSLRCVGFRVAGPA